MTGDTEEARELVLAPDGTQAMSEAAVWVTNVIPLVVQPICSGEAPVQERPVYITAVGWLYLLRAQEELHSFGILILAPVFFFSGESKGGVGGTDKI